MFLNGTAAKIIKELARLGPDFHRFVKNIDVEIELPKLTNIYNHGSTPALVSETSGFKLIQEIVREMNQYPALAHLKVALKIP
jgi:hypothetical protein